ncbi:MAG: aminopeptidase P family protein [Candidatus Marinimicrobia bacterium]|nr:aminopeptidase P family protein [Candidatus Neomarinimicrobiota bacterium]
MSTIKQNLNSIRRWLVENDLDIFIIPHADEYLSEYIPPENERLAWATGFTGSAGTAIVSHEKAAIFVDGRYTVQVKQQVDSSLYRILHISNNPWIKWLTDNHNSGAKIGYDPRMHRANWKIITEKKLKETIKLEAVTENPIDLYWDNRPKSVEDKAILLDQKYTGKSSLDKRLELGKVIGKNGCKAVFITQLDSIAWLLNIRGTDVPCNPVLLSHGILYADSTFDLFIPEYKIPDGFQQHVGENVQAFSPDKIQTRLGELSGSKVQFDAANSNIWAKNILSKAKLEILEKDDPCTLPKACKNSVEIEGMKNCHIRDAVAECNFLAWLDNEVENGKLHDEGILADKLDSLRAEQADFRGISFGTISAAGSNAAMCHYSHKNYDTPGKLEIDSVYLVDSGGQYLDGTTDITRTVAIGSPSDFTKKAFTLVLKGHIALGSAQFPEGIGGQHLDTLARQFLWHEGLDFDHGTGHGVGSYLNVHEGPHRIGKGSNKVPLKEGMVVSNEPGYYEEGQFGIRIENLIFVKKVGEVNGKKLLGFENLTFVPIDTRLLDHSIMTQKEKDWLNDYHNEVLEKVSPHVEGDVLEWLENATIPI